MAAPSYGWKGEKMDSPLNVITHTPSTRPPSTRLSINSFPHQLALPSTRSPINSSSHQLVPPSTHTPFNPFSRQLVLPSTRLSINSSSHQLIFPSTHQLEKCLFFSTNFNIVSALVIHQTPTRPQKNDSREGWFWYKKGLVVNASKMNTHCIKPHLASDFGLFVAKHSAFWC